MATVDKQMRQLDDVSLGILNVRLQDKLKRLTEPEDEPPEAASFVCDCGKPLRENAFFPCVVQSYLSRTVDEGVVRGLLKAFVANLEAKSCEGVKRRAKVAKVNLGRGRWRVGGGTRRRRSASIARRRRRWGPKGGLWVGAQGVGQAGGQAGAQAGAQAGLRIGRSRCSQATAARRLCRCALALCERLNTVLLPLLNQKPTPTKNSKKSQTAKRKSRKVHDNNNYHFHISHTLQNRSAQKEDPSGEETRDESVLHITNKIELDNKFQIEQTLEYFEEESSDETKELEEFERQERWASNEEYFTLNSKLFSNSSCQFDVTNLVEYERKAQDSNLVNLECYDELLESSEDDESPDKMRGDQPKSSGAAPAAEDRRHNKDVTKLKSSIKKMPRTKCKKNRVTFNENKNEFFEADYIILIREECQYDEESDEGICTCSQHEMVRLTCCDTECNGYEREAGAVCVVPPGEFVVDQVTLSPPEGYKDSGLFNQDGTFKDQSFFAREGPGLLVSEGSGAVFTPQHLRQLQVIQRLQREQLRRARASLVVDADDPGAHPEEPQHPEGAVVIEDPANLNEKDRNKGFYAKEIVAGEERPKVNSGQQTTPTDEEGLLYASETIAPRILTDARIVKEIPSNTNSEDSGIQEHHGPLPPESSPVRLGGILKGGRLWKSMEGVSIKPEPQQQIDTEESGNYSNSASDEEGRANRAVRFSEPPLHEGYDPANSSAQDNQQLGGEDAPKSHLALTFRLGNHLLSNNSLRPNSAVRQLFPAGPHLVAPPQRAEDDKRYLVTTESLRAFEEAKRTRLPSAYRDEDLSIRRNIDRNTLRRSLIKIDPRKKTPSKNDTSLTERIKMLTCNIDEEEAEAEPEPEQERMSPSGEEPRASTVPSAKSFSPSSSSSASSCSSTSSTYKKLTEIFPKRQDCITECNEEGSNVVIIPQNEKGIIVGDVQNDRRQYLTKIMPCGAKPGERLSLSSTGTDFSLTDLEASLEMPAPDVLAGTPGAGDGDELARFVQQDAARTERLRRRYQPSAENSDEDDQDDYGFQRRPSVRGIKPRFGSTNEILQQMQAQLQMGTTTPTTRPGHVSWPYYSESNLTQPAQHEHALHNPDGMHTSRSSTEDFQQKMGSSVELSNQAARDCYDLRNHNVPEHMQHVEHMQHMQHAQHKRIHDDTIYQNCVTYANIRCSVGERDLYSSQSSLVPLGTMSHMAAGYDSQLRNHRRPESPPPIRSYHQTMVLIPYSNLHQPHYSNTIDRSYSHTHAMSGEQNGSHTYQHQAVNDQPTLLKLSQTSQQLVGIPFSQAGVPMQITCSAPAAHIRTVPSRPVARHMICYSEKVEAPMYQAAPGSPVAVRGAPEGAPAQAASPTVPHNYPPHNSLYYAMNV
ncbi:uncharacterized protein LOC143922677 [Arctopsyche grandis]|uniref:uncharacterized protein LOC143922677 n=1 Tax=Arctopsyche grandis TaxID=121162 RepID=UPI00406D8879